MVTSFCFPSVPFISSLCCLFTARLTSCGSVCTRAELLQPGTDREPGVGVPDGNRSVSVPHQWKKVHRTLLQTSLEKRGGSVSILTAGIAGVIVRLSSHHYPALRFIPGRLVALGHMPTWLWGRLWLACISLCCLVKCIRRKCSLHGCYCTCCCYYLLLLLSSLLLLLLLYFFCSSIVTIIY